jgi:alpha-glucosidase
VGRHLRVLVELGAPASQQADAQYLGMARAWLNQGAAGLYVPTRALEKVDGVEHIALLLRQLRAMTDSFPGERVLLADAPAEQDLVLANALAKSTQLTASAPLGSLSGGAVTAATLRAEWMADLGDTSGTAAASMRHGRGRSEGGAGNPLLAAVRVPEMTDPAQRLALERTLAAMLLASRSAVLLEYGQELGLEMAGKNQPLMQWTPTNLTREPPPKVEPPAPQPETKPAYAGFQPFVRPLPRDFFKPPVMPVVVESFEPEPVDVTLLPGFTAGDFDASLAAGNGATANVALETADPGSLLNLYKQLIQLHHDNATVRSGSQTVLDRDAEDAVVWVRRAPASSRTSTTVVVGCNLSEAPVGLRDLGGVAVKSLRSLLQPGPAELLTVAPGAVVLGETR